MADEEVKGETPEVKVETTEQDEFDPKRAMALIEKLRHENRDLGKAAKRLTELEAAEAKKKEAELSEIDKLKADYDKATREIYELRILQLRREVADEVGLPPALAERLKGETAEDLKADAAKLKEFVPKPAQKSPGPTNPGSASTGETDAQKRKRLGF